jgi:hypothetical protein
MNSLRARNSFAQVSEELGSQSANTNHPHNVQQTIRGLMLRRSVLWCPLFNRRKGESRDGARRRAKGAVMIVKDRVVFWARVKMIVGSNFQAWLWVGRNIPSN